MADTNKTKADWKQKIVSGMIRYWILVGYLFLFFFLLVSQNHTAHIKSAHELWDEHFRSVGSAKVI